MTIAYKENVAVGLVKITPKLKHTEDYVYYGPKTTIEKVKVELFPNTEDPTKDKVTIIREKKPTIIEGSQIASSKICKELGITWYDPSAAPKERGWSLFDRYR
jgi:hypothetical protein